MKTFIEFSFIFRWFLIFAYASSTVLAAIENEEQRENGYDCGKTIFTDQMVQEALQMASIMEGPRPYVGPLYDDTLGYMTWPIIQDESTLQIKKKTKSRVWHETTFLVVFDTHGNVIDIIAKIRNHDFAKCLRVGNSELETEIPNKVGTIGYQCGQKLISNHDIEVSLDIARSKLGRDYTYPELYTGKLYRKELGYRIWPIYKGRGFYRSADDRGAPYYIVIDRKGRLKDVIVRIACKGKYFVRCMKSKNTLPPSSSATQNIVITESPKTGYDCNGIFFDDGDLKTAQAMARHSYKTRGSSFSKQNGPPFDSPYYLWPLHPFGKRLVPGISRPYRLVLTLDFDIMCVAIKSGDIIKKCEKITISSSHSQYSKNNYLCHNTEFTHHDLASAAKNACMKLVGRGSIFPQKYTEVEYDVPGPYFIYPIFKDKQFKRKPGKHRVVMTYNCLVVGALTIEPETGLLVKCKTTQVLNKSK